MRVKPVVTPDLQDPLEAATPNVLDLDQLFWPTVGNAKFEFTLECLDHDGKLVVLPAPLLFVGITRGTTALDRDCHPRTPTPLPNPASRHHAPYRRSARTSPTPRASKPGDTTYETVELRFTGDPGIPKTSDLAALAAAPDRLHVRGAGDEEAGAAGAAGHRQVRRARISRTASRARTPPHRCSSNSTP